MQAYSRHVTVPIKHDLADWHTLVLRCYYRTTAVQSINSFVRPSVSTLFAFSASQPPVEHIASVVD